MSKITRQAKRERQRSKRKQARKSAKKRKSGHKAGSLAIHSRLPGIEGTEIGSMDVIVDVRRKETHPAEISVCVHNCRAQRTVTWSIETGFGGLAARVGYQVLPDGEIEHIPPITWMGELPVSPADGDTHESACAVSPADGDTHESVCEVSPADGDTHESVCAVSPADGDTCESVSEVFPTNGDTD